MEERHRGTGLVLGIGDMNSFRDRVSKKQRTERKVEKRARKQRDRRSWEEKVQDRERAIERTDSR